MNPKGVGSSVLWARWLLGAAAEAPLALPMPEFSSDACKYKIIEGATVSTVSNINIKYQRQTPDL